MTRFQLCALLILLCPSTCWAVVKYWSKTSSMDLNIVTPPHVTWPTDPTVQYRDAGETFHIRCQVKGGNNATFQWLWNGQPIPTNQTHIKNTTNGTLKFHRFSFLQEGYFQCRASNQYGVSLSQIFEVRQRVTTSFHNKDPDGRSYTVNKGHGIALPCYDRPSFVPRGTYSWYYKSDRGQTQIPVHVNERMDMDVNGTLYIIQAERSDTGDRYACAAHAQRNIFLSSLPYVALKVQESDGRDFGPTLLGSTGFVTADKGGTTLMECFFSGKPRPKIIWRNGQRDTQVINGAGNRIHISPSGHQLTISGLVDDDEGKYVCVAESSAGRTTAVTFLNVTSRPLFVKDSPEIIIAPVGTNATFTCDTYGAFRERHADPPVWTLNGKSVPERPGKFSISHDRKRLTVFNVTKKDVMGVQCNVTNSRGYAFGDGYLAVIDPLRVTARPNRTIEVDPSKTRLLRLTIRVSSDHCCPPTFAWYLDERQIPTTALHHDPYTYTRSRTQATLSILLDGPEAEVEAAMGRYRCEVFHEAYSSLDKKNITVEVRRKAKTMRAGRPPVPLYVADMDEVKTTETSYWWVGVLCGVLVLVTAMVIIVLMIRYNYPRREYLLDREEKKHKLNPEHDILDQSFGEI